ncbi:MAG: hypothetical protein AABN34_21805 [Acidobacteriota bacterium]
MSTFFFAEDAIKTTKHHLILESGYQSQFHDCASFVLFVLGLFI